MCLPPLEAGDGIWGGGLFSLFFHLQFCFSYLGIRSTMSKVFFRTFLIFLSQRYGDIEPDAEMVLSFACFPLVVTPPLDETFLSWDHSRLHTSHSVSLHLFFCFNLIYTHVIDCVIFSHIDHPSFLNNSFVFWSRET